MYVQLMIGADLAYIVLVCIVLNGKKRCRNHEVDWFYCCLADLRRGFGKYVKLLKNIFLR